MKRYFSIFMVVSIVLSSFCFTISAAAVESEYVPVDSFFVDSASVALNLFLQITD